MPAIGQRIGAAAEPGEPAIDIALQDGRGIRHPGRGAQIGEPHRPRRGERAGEAQRILAIGGDDRSAIAAADIRVARAPLELGDQPSCALAGRARTVGRRLLDDPDRIASHQDEPKPEPSAQPADPWRLRHDAAPAPRAARHRQIDALAQSQPVDPLQHQRERKAKLQLDDDDRLGAAPGDEVATLHFALHLVAAAFEKALDRPIERGFGDRSCRKATHHRSIRKPNLSPLPSPFCDAALEWRHVPARGARGSSAGRI